MVAATCWGITLFLGNTQQYNHFSYISVTFQLHFSYISATFQLHFSYISATFQLHFSYISVTYQLHFSYISVTFPSKQSHFAAIDFCQRLEGWWKQSGKQLRESLFSSSVSFLMMSVASQKHHPFNADFSRWNRYTSARARSRELGMLQCCFQNPVLLRTG